MYIETPAALAARMIPRYAAVLSNSNCERPPVWVRNLSWTYFQSSAPGDCGRPSETCRRIFRPSTPASWSIVFFRASTVKSMSFL